MTKERDYRHLRKRCGCKSWLLRRGLSRGSLGFGGTTVEFITTTLLLLGEWCGEFLVS